MRRREFIKVLVSTAAWPFAAHAQQPAMPVVGFIAAGTSEGYALALEGFLKGLSETNYVDGKNIQIEYRWADKTAGRHKRPAFSMQRTDPFRSDPSSFPARPA